MSEEEKEITCEFKDPTTNEICGKVLSKKVIEHCEKNQSAFKPYKYLCYNHQSSFKKEKKEKSRVEKLLEKIPIQGHKNLKSCSPIRNLIEDGIFEIFGLYGTGKTNFLFGLATEIIMNGENLLWIDTESNSKKEQRNILKESNSYIYMPIYEHIMNIIQIEIERNMNPDVVFPDTERSTLYKGIFDRDIDYIFVDSIGLPSLGSFSTSDQKERFESIIDIEGLLSKLGEWSFLTGGLAVVSNQPVSEMSKANRPYGDKGNFFPKEIWELTFREQTPIKTTSELRAFKSRSYGKGYKLAELIITKEGIKIEWI